MKSDQVDLTEPAKRAVRKYMLGLSFGFASVFGIASVGGFIAFLPTIKESIVNELKSKMESDIEYDDMRRSLLSETLKSLIEAGKIQADLERITESYEALKVVVEKGSGLEADKLEKLKRTLAEIDPDKIVEIEKLRSELEHIKNTPQAKIYEVPRYSMTKWHPACTDTHKPDLYGVCTWAASGYCQEPERGYITGVMTGGKDDKSYYIHCIGKKPSSY